MFFLIFKLYKNSIYKNRYVYIKGKYSNGLYNLPC